MLMRKIIENAATKCHMHEIRFQRWLYLRCAEEAYSLQLDFEGLLSIEEKKRKETKGIKEKKRIGLYFPLHAPNR